MKTISVLLPIALLLSFGHVAAAQPPQIVTELWADGRWKAPCLAT